MKHITKYQANDGKVFDTEAKCQDYENLLERIKCITTETIGPKLDDIGFANGGGYIQHTQNTVAEYQESFLGLVELHFESMRGKSLSYIGRMLSDGGDGSSDALYSAFIRLYCTDKESREWGQPYYALNPGTGKNVCLNHQNRS